MVSLPQCYGVNFSNLTLIVTLVGALHFIYERKIVQNSLIAFKGLCIKFWMNISKDYYYNIYTLIVKETEIWVWRILNLRLNIMHSIYSCSNCLDNISTFYIYLLKNWYSNNAQSRAYPSKSKKPSFLSGLSYTKILSSYRKMSDYVLSFPFALSPFIHVDCSSKAWYMLRDT